MKKVRSLLYIAGMFFTIDGYAMLSSLSNSIKSRNHVSQMDVRGFSTVIDKAINNDNETSKHPDRIQQMFITKFWEVTKNIIPAGKTSNLSVDLRKNEKDGGGFFWLTGTMGAGKSSFILDFLSSLGRPIYSESGEVVSDKSPVRLETQTRIINDVQETSPRGVSPKVLDFLSSLEHMSYLKAVHRMDENYNYNSKILVYNFQGVGKVVKSRNKKWTHADAVFHNEYRFQDFGSTVRSIVVEEAQFLTPEQVKALKDFADKGNFVLCSGLIDDFKRNFFPGSSAINQLYTAKVRLYNLCENCHSNFAEINARITQDGQIMRDGPQILIGQNFYLPLCPECWLKERLTKTE